MEYSRLVQGLAATMRKSAASLQKTAWGARIWLIARYLLVVPAIYELELILHMIWTGTDNIPYWDEWRTVDTVRAFNTGTLSFQELVAFHNEHRIILPRLLDLLLIVLTHWNRQIEMTGDLAVAVATYALLCVVVYRTLPSRPVAFIICVLSAALVFTLGAATDWLAPFQVAFILTLIGAAICVWALAVERITWCRFALAAIGAVVATLSTAGGLMAWPAFFPVIWRGGWRQRGAWLALTLVSWGLYFSSLPATGLGSHHLSGYHLGPVMKFAFAYLGAPLGYPIFRAAVIAGAISAALIVSNIAVYWLVRRDLRPVLPWLGLALFVLGCMALTDFGRVTRDIGESLYTRHQVFSVMWWVVLLVLLGLNVDLLVHALRRHEQSPVLVVAHGSVVAISVGLLALIAPGFPRAAQTAWHEATISQALQKNNQQCFVHYANADQTCLLHYFWDPSEERPYAQYLQQAHLGIFYNSGAAVHAVRH